MPRPRRGPAAGTKSPVPGQPPRAPRSQPVNLRAQAPGVGKGTTALGMLTALPRAIRPDEARRNNAGPGGTPERAAATHIKGTRTCAKQQRRPGAANPGRAHNTQRTTAQEQVPGNTQRTHHKPQPGVAGYERSTHTNPHTRQHPGHEWQGAHTSTLHTPTRSGDVQEEHAHKHTQTPTPQPGVAGRSQNQSPSTHTHTAHPSQKWEGTSRTRTRTHTHPNNPARSGRAQPKPGPKHTHPQRASVPGLVG